MKKEKQTYKVGCYETVHAYIYVEALSEKDALKKANTILEKEWMQKEADVFDREFSACSSEKIG